MKIQPDSWPIRFLTRVCDLFLLNVVFMFACVTVVCSGTAMTALYSVTLRMLRGETNTPVKDFFRSIRNNFIPCFPATILLFVDVTLIAFLLTVLFAEELLISPTLFVALAIAGLLLTALLSWLFPLLARFENTFPRHLGNAVLLAAANLPVTFLITLVNLLPILLALALPELLGYLAAFWTFIGLAAGAYLNSFYLNRVFGLKKEEVETDE